MNVYLEIGTGDFDTLNDKFANRDNWKGMSIEAVPEHFERLPKLAKNQYSNDVCVVERPADNQVPFYYIPPGEIAKYGLPDWLRGCGAVDMDRQPSLQSYQDFVVKRYLPCLTVAEVVNMAFFTEPVTGKQRIDLLKIDTEGYDYILLNAILDLISPTTIIFETWGMTEAGFMDLDFRLASLGYHFQKRDGDNVQYGIPSVLMMGEEAWSTGSIIKDLMHLSNWRVSFLDWSKYPNDLEETLAEFDANVIMGLYSASVWKPTAKHGVVCCGPCELDPTNPFIIEHGITGKCFGAVSPECYYGLTKSVGPVCYTPASARMSRFERRPARPIRTLGWCGIPESAVNFGGKDLKRFSMFEEIVKATGLNSKVSHRDFTYDTMQDFYDSIDMLVCTSATEGGPLGPFEAIACGVPVISTPVGLIKEMKSVKTFATVDYAVGLINQIKNARGSGAYAHKQYSELGFEFSMEQFLPRWEAFFAECARVAV